MVSSIIIPVYGPEDLLTACLAAVWENTQGEYELVLVDNGTGYSLQGDIVLRNRKNLGYARACNQGAEAANGNVLVFLNVDTEVQPGWLPPLIAPLDNYEVGMTGARCHYPNGNIQHSGIAFRMVNGELEARNLHDELPSREVEGTTGACCAIRKRTFRALGGFDEGFDNGYDDVDLCLQVRAADYTIRYVQEARVLHHESATGKERGRSVKENVARLQQKWLGHPVVADVPTITLV